MKKLIINIVLLGSIVTGFAQSRVVYNNPSYNNARTRNALVIDTRGMHDFTVVVDNNMQYQSSGGAVTINSLRNGNHRIIVYETRKGLFGLGKQRQMALYSSSVQLKTGVETSVLVNHNGQADVSEKSLYGYYDNDNNRGDRRNNPREIRN